MIGFCVFKHAVLFVLADFRDVSFLYPIKSDQIRADWCSTALPYHYCDLSAVKRRMIH